MERKTLFGLFQPPAFIRCGDDEAARDMIIGHELGHVHAGHLRWRMLVLPASFIPFLGQALSQAREYTCDRYGWASAGDPDGAQLGLAILAAGRYGRMVNRQALVRQRLDMATGWMTIGRWLSTHPPLAHRLYALDPDLGEGREPSSAGTLRAAAIVGLLLLPFFAVVWFGGKGIARTFSDTIEQARAAAASLQERTPEQEQELRQQLDANVQAVAAFLQAEAAQGRALPGDSEELRARWESANPLQPLPVDPFDGFDLGYYPTNSGFILWSTGPDGEVETDDDLEFTFTVSQPLRPDPSSQQ